MSSLPEFLRVQLLETTKPKTRAKKHTREPRPADESLIYNRLDTMTYAAIAGAHDADLAARANTVIGVVRRWRKDRGIQRSHHVHRGEATAYAMALFGGETRDVLHRAAASPVAGAFEPPKYVLRPPLDYTALCRALYAMSYVLGYDEDQLIRAFGLQPNDIRHALQLWRAHLDEIGRLCPGGCGLKVDPRFDEKCSPACGGGS